MSEDDVLALRVRSCGKVIELPKLRTTTTYQKLLQVISETCNVAQPAKLLTGFPPRLLDMPANSPIHEGLKNNEVITISSTSTTAATTTTTIIAATAAAAATKSKTKTTKSRTSTKTKAKSCSMGPPACGPYKSESK